jgi:uncharacterized protein (DUF3084 family)
MEREGTDHEPIDELGKKLQGTDSNWKNMAAAFHGHIKQLEKKLQETDADKQQLDGQIKELKKKIKEKDSETTSLEIKKSSVKLGNSKKNFTKQTS